MAKKISKNQRVNRGGESQAMARLVLAEKKENGSYRFRQKMVPADTVQDELKAARQ